MHRPALLMPPACVASHLLVASDHPDADRGIQKRLDGRRHTVLQHQWGQVGTFEVHVQQ